MTNRKHYNSKNMYRILLLLLSLFILIGCSQSTPADTASVYNFHDKEQLEAYTALNLDDTHPNLLNPQVSQDEISKVIGTWSDLHQRVGKHLAEHNFSWGVEDSSIAIVQKIYFKPDGEVTHYFFNVLNKSVSKKKKEEFSNLLKSFASENKINITREEQFAQCGKTRYMNL